MSSSNFETFREQLHQSRQALDQGKERLFLAGEKLKRVQAQQAQLERHFDPQNEAHIAEQNRLKTLHAETERRVGVLGSEVAAVEKGLLANLEAFLPLTDPREQVESLSDLFPVLLLPLRLETRFKALQVDDETTHQLWVRVYPDDCAVDTFEAALSETEVRNAQVYWAEVWCANEDDLKWRAAWRNLVASHGVGRALWIVEHYRPLNEGERPHVDANKMLLIIATNSPLDAVAQEQTALFWQAVWQAGEDAQALAAVQEAFINEVGPEQAKHVTEQYRPLNLEDAPPAGQSRADTDVVVATVVFESAQDTEMKRRAWSRAPRVTVLPDRLVLLGYADETLVIDKLGKPIPSPLIVGPDPLADEAKQVRQVDDEIVVSDDMRWMVDFDEAVQKGMGFRVELSEAQYTRGFDTLMVLGVRLSANERAGQETFEQLMNSHHCSQNGLSLLRQGTATNNTEDKGSGYTTVSDADDTFDLVRQEEEPDEPVPLEEDWFQKTDGQWLAHWLGIDPSLMRTIGGANNTDILEAQAINTALFPATIGYLMNTMLSSVFGDAAVEFTRQFFTRFVSGRGMVPAVRIGKQPYGILPATVYSRLKFPLREGVHLIHHRPVGMVDAGGSVASIFDRLYAILMRAYQVWGELRQDVSHVGQPGDPHQILLDVLGLHATSVEYDQRYAESLQQVLNSMNLSGLLDRVLAVFSLLEQGADILRDHGYDVQKRGRPDLLDKFFFADPYPVNMENLIHDRQLSEEAGIRAYTTDGENYIQWLVKAAKTSLETIRKQEGFVEGDTPNALLYLMLKHAITLGYYDAGIRLYADAGVLTDGELQAMRVEPNFIHVADQVKSSESRFKMLYATDPVVTGEGNNLAIAEYITSVLATSKSTARLREQVAALSRLEELPTARLERIFVEHLDTCTYRLDSWLQGLVQYQLARMRFAGVQANEPRQGLYLGAYGWLEDLRPEGKHLEPVELEDAELADIFQRAGDPPLMRDSDNSGYIHAPSPNHAVTAAVLRNGYRSHSSPGEPGIFSVNLSSERVRRAMGIIQGMHNGQSLGALLGYQFERGLHDRHDEAEVDKFIFGLRKAFPLVADHIRDTARPVDDQATSTEESISAIEARNVLDGEALVDHIQETGSSTYPFGKNWLPSATEAQEDAINAEVQRLLDTHDAVADLGIAEGIHQIVQGNYDRAAASLESFASGQLPPIPEVVQTPRSGIGLTHRVGLHLRPGLLPDASPVPGLDVTPRASAEPALNHWLASLLPAPDQVGVSVRFSDGTGAAGEGIVTQADLGLQPIDLLYMLHPESEQAMTVLDDLIVRHVLAGLRPDATVTIYYTTRLAPTYSLFEIAALMNQLRALVSGARPLRALDVAMPLEADDTALPWPEYRPARLTHVRDQLAAATSPLQTLRDLEAELAPLLDDPVTNHDALVDHIDDCLARFVAAMAELSVYGLPQTGYGFALDWRRARYAALLSKVRDLVDRWGDKLDQFDAMMTDYGNLPLETDVDTRFERLREIEAVVSMDVAESLTGTIGVYEGAVNAKRAAFEGRRTVFADLLGTTTPNLASLLDDIQMASADLTQFDFVRLDLEDDAAEIVRFSGDLLTNSRNLVADLDARIQTVDDALTDYAAATSARAREAAFTHAAQTLLGEGFLVLPEFAVPALQADELQKAYNASDSLLDHLKTTLQVDLPVDDWLYGVARVRDMMQRWEALTILAEAFKGTDLDLLPMQLPFKENDSWLALPYPDSYEINTDKLLYTAHFATPFAKSAMQCGLLLDEWTEVIPTTEETTGVTFHYDRPNAEPPQVMILATPPHINGKWEWADLVDTLHETLELAKRRAVEPDQISGTDYARFLPATISAVTFHPITIALNYAVVNQVYSVIQTGDDDG